MLATQRKSFNACSFFGGGGEFCIQTQGSRVVSVSCFRCGALPRSIKVAQKKRMDGPRSLLFRLNIISLLPL